MSARLRKHIAALRLVLRMARTATTELEAGFSGIVMLPGKRLVNGRPDHEFRQRLRRCLNLAKTGQVTALIASGADTNQTGVSEAQCAQNWLLENGWPPDKALYIEENATDTGENFQLIAELLNQIEASQDVTNTIVVSNRYHLARCTALARQAGLSVQPIAAENNRSIRWRDAWREAGYLANQVTNFSEILESS